MKNLTAIFVLSLLMPVLFQACGNPVNTVADNDVYVSPPAPWDLVDEGEDPLPTRHSYLNDFDTIQTDTETALNDSVSVAQQPTEELAEETDEITELELPPVNLARYQRLGRLNELFNDSNKYQYAAGERIGIKPIKTLADAYYTRRPLVKISSNRYYTVEDLKHSMPYLVPEAAALLETIGRNFEDSLRRKNIQGYKFRITSLLRSSQSVKKLRRVNRNATDSSTHQLGTTFDISYARFDRTGAGNMASDEELKYVLAEVLRDLRTENKCLIKYERKSPCFHITATGI